MKWVSSITLKSNLSEGIRDIRRSMNKTVNQEGPPDLALLFVSPHHLTHYQKIDILIQEQFKPRTLIGCSAGGVIGNGKEVENKMSMSLTCAWLPDVKVNPFYIKDSALPDLDASPKEWHKLLKITPDQHPQFILIAEPQFFRTENFLSGMDFAFPDSTKVGGLASGSRKPIGNVLYFNKNVYQRGLVGVALSGNINIDTVVSQGCRPIGKQMTITKCQDQILFELNNEPPLQILEELYDKLPPRDQKLLRKSLFLGFLKNSPQPFSEHGNFLVRNIIGADMDKGILAVGSELRPGQIVQFYLRDAETSAADLHEMLSRHTSKKGNQDYSGALLFSCLGRGTFLYGKPNHDSEIFLKKVGNIPLGGFFCNGEIGPVGTNTYIHGYTSCFSIFRSNSSGKAIPSDTPHQDKIT